MSSKKRSGKSVPTSAASVEDDGGNFIIPAEALPAVLRTGKSNGRNHVAAARPGLSRVVNHNCLRPHGALNPGDLEAHLHSDGPPESLMQDIVAAVNGSQKLLRRTPDFTILADSKEVIGVLHRTAFRHWWLESVAKECLSAAAYPFTSFRFRAPLSGDALGFSLPVVAEGKKEVNTCISTAEAIRRILLVFARNSNNGDRASEELLFHMLQNEKASVEELLLTSYNSHYITVCCGLYFYRVDVLDQEGLVVSADTIAERLRAVKEHADCTERALRQQTILPEALEELVAFYQLIGRLTEISHVDCAAIMERMRNANPVNKASLDAIDAGIFTVVLRNRENGASCAHWYRSALVLEEEEESGVLTMRGHSTLMHSDMLMQFLLQVLCWNEDMDAMASTRDESLCTANSIPADVNQVIGMEHLEIWLPWKHRKPMQPYAVAQPSPQIFPIAVPSEGIMSFASLCVSAVLAVQRVLTPCEGFPAVLIAFPHPQGAVSAALLYSCEVEALIQSLCCGSALVKCRAMRQLALEALRSVGNIIDMCFHEPYPLYSMTKLLVAQEKAAGTDAVAEGGVLGVVDLFVTVDMLGSSAKVMGCKSSLVLPSRFALSCNATGSVQRQPPSKGPSGVHVTFASLVSLKGEEELAIGMRLANCMSEKAKQLLSLLSM
ncbi:hypothetical protein DQ04_00441030 [Trypanosoma grayi]|uniref:hypothetical protein n=1 Tax=Trypanosoma grayi TaxID=71804 RepID=UPI0004F427C0|nr:hypothetical protein DQ04_00441030 [Trypanosoma grayi]KEG14478.1 hypothetical protein DQ04_00441030 [Trypanosoma grayi]